MLLDAKGVGGLSEWRREAATATHIDATTASSQPLDARSSVPHSHSISPSRPPSITTLTLSSLSRYTYSFLTFRIESCIDSRPTAATPESRPPPPLHPCAVERVALDLPESMTHSPGHASTWTTTSPLSPHAAIPPTRRPSMYLNVVNPVLIPHGFGTTYCARLPFLFRIVFVRIRVDICLPYLLLCACTRHQTPAAPSTRSKSRVDTPPALKNDVLSPVYPLCSPTPAAARVTTTPPIPCCERILGLTRPCPPPRLGVHPSTRLPDIPFVRSRTLHALPVVGACARGSCSCASPQNNDDPTRDGNEYHSSTYDGRSSYYRPTSMTPIYPDLAEAACTPCRHIDASFASYPCTHRPRARILASPLASSGQRCNTHPSRIPPAAPPSTQPL
ncbi:hypothetical protein C8R45DRAFT_419133 [Mycena sanguinolenta]|nr:hypothetical protein C8R45DRAFT_419133 [Mycena sanguinolenta]